VRWHEPYRDPASALSVRLCLVQSAVSEVLDAAGPGPIRVISLCAGQGRDVIDVMAGHRRSADVSALLVELEPALAAFARERAAAAGVGEQVMVVQGDAARCAWYADVVPAHLVLVCGVFGNISDEDLERTVGALPAFCAPGADVVWTRHRRPPDKTPLIRRAFGRAGFEEVSFEAPPDPYVLTVGRHRWVGRAGAADGGGGSSVAFDPDLVLFEFVGDGSRPA
jgi:hypothetical protein